MIVTDDDGSFVKLEGGGYFKVMRVERLRELLDDLDSDLYICVNRVGNLSILNSKLTIHLGMVDFNSELFELWDETSDG